MLLPDDPQVYAYLRRYRGVEVLVVTNLAGQPAHAAVDPGWAAGDLLLGNLGAPDPTGTGLALRPWQAAVLRRRPA